jgi:hypothetical protein
MQAKACIQTECTRHTCLIRAIGRNFLEQVLSMPANACMTIGHVAIAMQRAGYGGDAYGRAGLEPLIDLARQRAVLFMASRPFDRYL